MEEMGWEGGSERYGRKGDEKGMGERWGGKMGVHRRERVMEEMERMMVERQYLKKEKWKIN